MSTQSVGADTVGDMRRALLAARLAGGHRGARHGIPRVPRPGRLVTSFGQQQLWFLSVLDPGSPEYVIPLTMWVGGELDLAALDGAWRSTAERHEVLRTRYQLADADLLQVVDPVSAVPPVRVSDLAEVPADRREEHALGVARAEAGVAFDLGREHPARVHVLRLAADRHLLVLTVHHIAGDGWSSGLLVDELFSSYLHLVGSPEAPPLPDLPVQYADVAAWQRARLTGDALERELGYWRTQLAGVPVIELPLDHPRSARRSWAGDRYEFEVPPGSGDRLRDLARRYDTTLFTVGFTAFRELLHRWSGQSDLTVGTAVAGRSRPEVQHLVGYFLNTVVLRSVREGDPSFAQLLEHDRALVLDALSHQEAPVPQLVEELQPRRDPSRTPLFQVMYDMVEASPRHLVLPGLEVDVVDVVPAAAKHDLRLELTARRDGGLRGVLEYPTALFGPGTVQRFAAHLCTLLDAVTHDPTAPLSTVEVMGPGERAAVLGPRAGETAPAVLHPVSRRVAELARTAPADPAVVQGMQRLTFAQLHERSNRVAHVLRDRGVRPGATVAVCLERGLDLLPCLLGVWRAGAAYVPLDPGDPPARSAAVLADSGAVLTITRSELPAASAGGAVLAVDLDGPEIDGAPSADLPGEPDPSAVAYLVYTSGSTGRPKGVLVTHGNLANYLGWAAGEYLSADGNGAALFSSIAFDLVVTTLFLPVVAGQPVHLLPADLSTRRLGPALAEAAGGRPFSFLKLTPGHLELLVDQLDGADAAGLAHHLVVGGEAFPASLAARWWDLAGGTGVVVNEYGPTENTVANVVHRVEAPTGVPADGGGSLPIGRAVPGTSVHCLGPDLAPVPPGVEGELHLGGAQLALGYRDLPGLTAERFVPDPFGPPGARLYRTGDRARVGPDGVVAFLGRRDEQLKVRGHRVEAGEVESALRTHPLVRDAVVTLRTGAAGTGLLVAYVTTDAVTTDAPADPSAEDLRRFVAGLLPEHMVPAHVVVLEDIPLTSNGKVDRAALPDPDRAASGAAETAAAPRSPLEQQLVTALASTLGLAEVGVDDDFFDIGGDSLSAVALVGQLRAAGLDLAVDDVFAHSTPAELAGLLLDRQPLTGAAPRLAAFDLVPERDRAALAADLEDAYPLTTLQAGMLVEMFSDSAVNYYHNATTYLVRDGVPFSPAAFRAAVERVVQRQEVLRTGFDMATFSEPMQLVHRTAQLPTTVEDAQHLPPAAQDELVRARMAEERARLFDVSTPSLLRLHAVVRAPGEWSLIITECHPIMEGWSYHMLLMELLTCYGQLRDGKTVVDPEPLGVRFADHVAAERAALADPAHRDHWRGVVDGAARWSVPSGWGGAGERAGGGPIRVEVMFADLEPGLRALARTAEVPFKAVLHAAHLKVMSMLTDEPRFLSGLVCDTRPEVAGADRLYGLFLNTVPFPFELTAATWRELVTEVFAQEIELWPHRRYPLGAIQRDRPGGGRLLDVVFNYLDFRTVDEELVDFGASIDDSQIEFALSATAFRQGLLTLRLHPDAVDRDHGERLAAMYRLVLVAMSEDPDGDAWAARLPDDELRRSAEESTGAAPSEPASDVPQLFEAAARAVPDALALVLPDGHGWTFRDLDERSNKLAHYLRTSGIGRDQFVGICVEPGLELLVGVLGVLKAGAAYLPLDPAHPPARSAHALHDCGARMLLTQDHLDGRLPPLDIPALYLDGDWPAIEGQPDGPVPRRVHPDNLAYCIYTSGSTGRPKGVLVTHRGLANYLTWAMEAYTVPGGGGAPLLGSIAFDLTVTNLLVPLVAGQRVTALPVGRETEAVAGMIAGPGIDLLKATPGHLDVLHGLLSDAPGRPVVGTVVVGGEQLPLETVLAWHRAVPGVRIVNEYGPTETVVGCIVHDVPADPDQPRPVAIGRPIAGTSVRVLDRHLQPVPRGVPGELYVGGEGVARGYGGRPDLTADRFVPDPAGPPGARVYRTGDVVRRRAAGDLEFLGRRDHQLSFRGYRIEPGEIEARLLRRPGVAEAVVVLGRNPAGDSRLVGYAGCPGPEQPTPEELRAALRRELPEHLVPGLLVVLPALPRSAANKVDRAALPVSDRVPATSAAYVAPRNALERRLTELWEDVLGVERLGIEDPLRDLGADSLSALRVAAAADDLGVVMSPHDALAFPTVAQLAQHLLGGSTEDLARTLLADSELAEEIHPHGPPADPDGPVLLTGATGFLGAHVLAELLRTTDRRVRCLVRGADVDAAQARLRASADRWRTAVPEALDRVEVVAGDLGADRLGLSEADFGALGRSVSAIYHCGADVNAVHPYAAMRAVNVGGTREVLRLACEGTTTPVHHVSTMSVFTPETMDSGQVDETSGQVDPPAARSSGYGQSKWVAENLVVEAGRRGLPVTVIRMARVSWSTRTGVANSDDLVTRAMSAALRLGMVPAMQVGMTLTPVDRVAAGIVEIGRRTDTHGGCFHLISPHRLAWDDLISWTTACGHPLETVDARTFRDALVEAARPPGGADLRPLVLLLPRTEDGVDLSTIEDDYVPPVETWWSRHGGHVEPITQADVEEFVAGLAHRPGAPAARA
ncbi:non-ribosomal peptide synthetase [Modestobacter sp. Leaf380]|uniref:non-ribosomal peptide synthetase n=1 Tax=Modestobacter sp. Leaf380 TaxID=1736356 RepID=UPI00070028C8|nr:non-ribosomal peptide synthetase [Modestobacter sp. Leaf380]KQS63650.1 hypothetical protein ASG41_18610 [Modestobacter sp. Leaf380]